MKKLIVVLILLLFTSCNTYITKNIYEKTYDSTELNVAQIEINYFMYYYGLDSISLDKWITNKMCNDTIQIEQKIVRKIINKKSNYSFIFSKYVYPSYFYYQFVIRFRGNKNDFINK
jgi:hypothetical protein